jgi:group II intron reverse transcriptase/maturase
MNGRRKSDRSVRSEKSPNRAPERAAEAMEKRDLAGGKSPECNTPRTQSRSSVPSALERIRQVAEKDRRQRFTALLHHVYDGARLKAAYEALKPKAAAGVDGVTWHEYGQHLGDNLRDLADRLRRGAYRALPVRRVFIPKADGRQRPIGVPALEDKIVQRAVVEVLNAIYESDFLGFSYGFRPGRGQHDALDAISAGLMTKKVNWVLDGDIRSFFDTLKHEWLIKFLEHRVADRRIVHLIQKWLRAGVLEDGKRLVSELGTVQGGSVSPLLANLYLHYVLDLWAQQWRTKRARGEMIVVRYADDFVAGFQHRADAESFHAELRERFKQFGLELHPEKTRTLEFGRFAARDRESRGEGSPEAFNFLGFTHSCAKTRSGGFTVLRQTMAKRMQAKLAEVKQELLRRRQQPVSKQGSYVRSVVSGHVRYYGVPMNSPALGAFRFEVGRLWTRSLERRSQRPLRWKKMERLLKRWLPPARVCHPYPLTRFGVRTRGKSRMR